MPSTAELQILMTAKDTASTAMRAFAGVMSSVVVGALSDAARAAAADEASVGKLRVAVENAGAAWQDSAAAIETHIKAGQAMAFTDDAVRDSIGQLSTALGDVSKAMDLQGLAMDVSRGRTISLAAATDIVQKAALGQFGAIKKLGIVLAEGSTATEALGELQKRYAGQATTYGDSTAASIFMVKDSIDEWKESIGAALGPAQELFALLPGLSAGFTLVSSVLALATPAMKAWTVATAAAVAPLLLVIATGVLVVAALLQIWETVTLVTDNWNVFVYALTRGDLNDIPVFGMFFHLAQNVLSMISNILSAWNNLTSAISSFQMPSISLPSFQLPSFAAGGVVPGPIGAPVPVIAHGGERFLGVDGGGGGAGLVININMSGPIYGMADFEDKVKRTIRDAVSGGGFRGVLTVAPNR